MPVIYDPNRGRNPNYALIQEGISVMKGTSVYPTPPPSPFAERGGLFEALSLCIIYLVFGSNFSLYCSSY